MRIFGFTSGTAIEREKSMIVFSSLCSTGKQRKENQDAVLGVSSQWNGQNVSLLCISDGMGGLSEGKRASAVCVDGLSAWYQEVFTGDSNHGQLRENLDEVRDRLFDSFCQVHTTLNRKLYDEASTKRQDMGATCTSLLIIGDAYACVHVGDTRLYIKRPHRFLSQLTDDDSLAYLDFQQGKIRKGAIRRHPKRNVLTRCMGYASSIKLETSRGVLSDGEAIFLCSDGVHGYCSDIQINSTMNTALRKGPEAGIRKLDRAILRSPAADNYSMIMATFRRESHKKQQTALSQSNKP